MAGFFVGLVTVQPKFVIGVRLGSFRWSNLLVGFGVRLRLRCGRCSFFFYGDVEDGYSGENLFERLNDVVLVCV